MSPQALMALLHEIEARLPVETWFVDGVPVWPVMRIYLLFALDSGGDPAATLVRRSRLSLLANASDFVSRVRRIHSAHRRALQRDEAHEARIDGRVDVAFLSHTTCRTFRTIEGCWYDSFCQPVVELLDERRRSSFIFEYAPDDEYRVPRCNRTRLIEPRLAALRIWNEIASARHVALPAEDELGALVRERSGLDPPFALVRRRVCFIRRMANWFLPLLARLAPHVAFVVNYYDARCMAFVLACHDLGIRSIDIQHGVQGELHGAYGAWHRVPEGGYSVLPSLFWCWSEREARSLRRWTDGTNGAHSVVVAGNLIVSRFLDGASELARAFDPLVGKIAGTADRNVLFTLQPGRDLPPFVQAAIAASPSSWQWWLRLHPAMRADGARIAATLRETMPGARIDVEQASDLPLYALLRHMDVHVTELSSTVLEAEQFGVPSIVCNATGAELFADAIVRGAARFADSETALLDLISRQPRRDDARRRAQERAIDADALDRLVRGAAESRVTA